MWSEDVREGEFVRERRVKEKERVQGRECGYIEIGAG